MRFGPCYVSKFCANNFKMILIHYRLSVINLLLQWKMWNHDYFIIELNSLWLYLWRCVFMMNHWCKLCKKKNDHNLEISVNFFNNISPSDSLLGQGLLKKWKILDINWKSSIAVRSIGCLHVMKVSVPQWPVPLPEQGLLCHWYCPAALRCMTQ